MSGGVTLTHPGMSRRERDRHARENVEVSLTGTPDVSLSVIVSGL